MGVNTVSSAAGTCNNQTVGTCALGDCFPFRGATACVNSICECRPGHCTFNHRTCLGLATEMNKLKNHARLARLQASLKEKESTLADYRERERVLESKPQEIQRDITVLNRLQKNKSAQIQECSQAIRMEESFMQQNKPKPNTCQVQTRGTCVLLPCSTKRGRTKCVQRSSPLDLVCNARRDLAPKTMRSAMRCQR